MFHLFTMTFKHDKDGHKANGACKKAIPAQFARISLWRKQQLSLATGFDMFPRRLW
jgi:hypothetical protein